MPGRRILFHKRLKALRNFCRPAERKTRVRNRAICPQFSRFGIGDSAQYGAMQRAPFIAGLWVAALFLGAAAPAAPVARGDDAALTLRPSVTLARYEPHASSPVLRPAILDRMRPCAHACVQLGAFRVETHAAQGWDLLAAEAGGLLSGLTPQIVSVDFPDRGRFWRLRVGPLDGAGAAALCRKLKARGLDCFTVKG